MSAVVTRSLDDAKAKQSLLAQYIAECERIEEWRTPENVDMLDIPRDSEDGKFSITDAERMEVFERRRDRLHNDLVNAGIRLHAETSGLKSLAGVIEQNHANKDQT